MSARKSVRAGLSALLATGLFASGALLTAPAAYAEEAPASESATEQSVPAPETPIPEAKQDAPAPEPTESAPEPSPESEVDDEVPQPETTPTPATQPMSAAKSSSEERGASTAPQLSVSKAEGLDPAGETITVSGEGYNPEQSIYVFLCEDIELPTNLFVHAGGCQDGSVRLGEADSGKDDVIEADGSFSIELEVKQLDDAAMAVYTTADHTAMRDRSLDAKALLEFAIDEAVTPQLSLSKAEGLDPEGETITVSGAGYNPEQAIYVFLCEDVELPRDLWGLAMGCRDGAEVVYAPGKAPDGKTEFDEDGSFELEFEVKQVGNGATSVYTAANHTGMTDRSQDAKVVLEFVGNDIDRPHLSVTPATGLSDGDTVTVEGTGYNPDQAIYVTTCTEAPLKNVDFDFISDGCRTGAKLVWGHEAAPRPGADEFKSDGSFKLTMDLVQHEGSTALYTIADHTAMGDRSQDAKATLKFESDSTNPDPDPNPGANVTSKVTKVTPGKSLDVKVTASGLPPKISNAYAAVIEKGTEDSLSEDDPYPAMEAFAAVSNGKLSETLKVNPANVKRTKQYEVIVWEQHSAPNASTIYGRTDVSISKANWDRLFSVKPQKPTSPKAAARGDSQQAGSLRWGVSSQFADYTTNKNRAGGRSGGKILTSGVGGGSGAYVFPQATGGSWNTESQTGTVRYSGVVTFTAHGGAMNESFANPVITVTSASSGTISAGGHTFGLNLAGGSKSVGSNGEVTWSGVPLSGSISGGSGGSGGSFGADPVTFTVGAASGVNYGSTSVESDTGKREPAASPPATTGIEVLTSAEDIVPGGEIEFVAPGFDSGERDILVVLYSDPIVLDESAGANADGTVRWIGNLPEDIDLGEHTITLQGESYDAGAVIEVVDPEETQDQATTSAASPTGAVPATVANAVPFAGAPMWVWWASAIGLLVLAGATTTLVVAQRRK
ncbi:MAG: neocarzinostatin apoprotein domain-containing protein [Leucobacter sp.]